MCRPEDLAAGKLGVRKDSQSRGLRTKPNWFENHLVLAPFSPFQFFQSIYDITFTSKFVLTLIMRYVTVGLVSRGPLNKCVSRLEFCWGCVPHAPLRLVILIPQ
jgi:hypothetical protein